MARRGSTSALYSWAAMLHSVSPPLTTYWWPVYTLASVPAWATRTPAHTATKMRSRKTTKRRRPARRRRPPALRRFPAPHLRGGVGRRARRPRRHRRERVHRPPVRREQRRHAVEHRHPRVQRRRRPAARHLRDPQGQSPRRVHRLARRPPHAALPRGVGAQGFARRVRQGFARLARIPTPGVAPGEPRVRGVYLPGAGTWRSLVAHLLWEQGVGGSNPPVPTSTSLWAGVAQLVEHQPSKLRVS